MKRIVLTFNKKGDCKIEAFGFTGGDCLRATRDIEEALGKVEGRKMKNASDAVVAEQTVKA